MIAFCGSITRKYTTALTLTETLSREITSWLGTSMTTVRKPTLTICWMPGIISTNPGPFTFQNRPSINTTPRSYSRSMRTLENANKTSINKKPPKLKFQFISFSLNWYCQWAQNHSGIVPFFRLHIEDQPVHANDPNLLSLSLIHISEPTRLGMISYAVFC